jgi:membrane protease YdiL (CAAX protease family)
VPNLDEALIFAFLAASAWAWYGVARRLEHGQPALRSEPRAAVPWGLADLMAALFLLSLGVAIATQWVQAHLRLPQDVPFEKWPLSARGTMLLATSVASIAGLLAAFAWLVLRYRIRPAELGLQRGRLARDVAIGTTTFLLISPLVFGLQTVLTEFFESRHPLLELAKQGADFRFFAISILSAVVIAPIVEEYMFRVLLQSWLERITRDADFASLIFGGRDSYEKVRSPESGGEEATDVHGQDTENLIPRSTSSALPCSRRSSLAILVSALIFALMHRSHGPDPVPLFLLAVALGYVFSRTGRVLPCIVAHALLNATTIVTLAISIFYESK